jgi:hypothetical protein
VTAEVITGEIIAAIIRAGADATTVVGGAVPIAEGPTAAPDKAAAAQTAMAAAIAGIAPLPIVRPTPRLELVRTKRTAATVMSIEIRTVTKVKIKIATVAVTGTAIKTRIATGAATRIVIAIKIRTKIVTVIRIVIATKIRTGTGTVMARGTGITTEIGIAIAPQSTTTRSLTHPATTTATGTVRAPTSVVIRTAFSLAPTMLDAGKATTPKVRTFSRTGTMGIARSLVAEISTSKPIATVS